MEIARRKNFFKRRFDFTKKGPFRNESLDIPGKSDYLVMELPIKPNE